MYSGHFILVSATYVLLGIGALVGVLLVLGARDRRRPAATARHRAGAGAPSYIAPPPGPWLPAVWRSRPVSSQPASSQAASSQAPRPVVPTPRAPADAAYTMQYPVWPGDPVRPHFVDAPGRSATQSVNLRDWHEDPYAGNVTDPHDPWRALYESVARQRRRDPRIPQD